MQKNSITQNYKKISTIYNQVWIVLIVIVFGIIIMQLISGNLNRDRLETVLNQEEFNCEQTALSEVTPLPSEPLRTDMSVSIIDTRTELVQTAQLKNNIPQVATPEFGTLENISECTNSGDEFVVVTIGSSTKLYPKKLLAQHLIVNDFVDNTPVLVSYCILCDTVKVYERIVDGEVRIFGNTGLLYRNSDLFYDDKTESLWSQFTGQALVGKKTTTKLSPVEFRIISYNQAKEEFPHAETMNFNTGFRANYSDTSYKDFASIDRIVAPIDNINDEIEKKETVLGFVVNDKHYAVETSRIKNGEKFFIESQPLTGKVDSGEILLMLDDDELFYTKSFWYVWYDFYPDTIILRN